MKKYLLLTLTLLLITKVGIQAQVTEKIDFRNAIKEINKNQRYFKDLGKIHFEDGLKWVNGTHLYYKIIGKGEPIVILHGGPGMDHNYLIPNVGKLADEFQLIFYDQRGTGNSSAKIDSSAITIDNFVEDLETLRESLGLKKINLMGFSWGSLLAMHYAIKYPDRLNTLILGCPTGATSDFIGPFVRALEKNWTMEDSLDLAKIRQTEAYKNGKAKALTTARRITYRPYFYNPELAAHIKFNYGKNTLKNGSIIYSLLWAEIRNYDIREELKIISSPTLIIYGDSDPIPRQSVEQIHQAIPNSEFILLENSGHWIFIEAEQEFLEVVRNFIKREME